MPGDAIVVPTMTTAPAWRRIAPGDLAVTCAGFMGGASSLGLGMALARPDRRVLARVKLLRPRASATKVA